MVDDPRTLRDQECAVRGVSTISKFPPLEEAGTVEPHGNQACQYVLRYSVLRIDPFSENRDA